MRPSFNDIAESAQTVETRFRERKVVWRRWGTGSPLECLHGGFGSWNHFKQIIPHLEAQFSVICPDMPGYGDSDMPVSDDLACSIPDALADGLRQQVGTSSIDVVGFSFGSVVSGLLCRNLRSKAEYPIPRRLALIGPAGLGVEMGRITGGRSLPPGLEQLERYKIHANNLSLTMLSRKGNIDEHTIRLQDANVRRTRVRGFRLSRSSALEDALQTMPVEALAATWGDQDPYLAGMHRDVENVLRGIYPETEILIQKGKGHWVQHEAPEATAMFLSDFFTA